MMSQTPRHLIFVFQSSFFFLSSIIIAHCGFNKIDISGISFNIGALCPDDDTGYNCGQHNEIRHALSVWQHPDYNTTTNSNDLALIRLDSPSTVEPVSIDVGKSFEMGSIYDGKPLWVIGEYPYSTYPRERCYDICMSYFYL